MDELTEIVTSLPLGKVHIVKWIPTGKIHGVYSDYKKACTLVENANKNRTWKHKLHEALNLVANKWSVQTFDVKD